MKTETHITYELPKDCPTLDDIAETVAQYAAIDITIEAKGLPPKQLRTMISYVSDNVYDGKLKNADKYTLKDCKGSLSIVARIIAGGILNEMNGMTDILKNQEDSAGMNLYDITEIPRVLLQARVLEPCYDTGALNDTVHDFVKTIHAALDDKEKCRLLLTSDKSVLCLSVIKEDNDKVTVALAAPEGSLTKDKVKSYEKNPEKHFTEEKNEQVFWAILNTAMFDHIRKFIKKGIIKT